MLYGRKWKITVETHRGTVFELPPELRVTFSLDRMIGRAYQFGAVTIYNLNAQTEQDLFQNAKSVTIEAGYENGPYGLIFDAKVVQPLRGKEDATSYYLKLMCLDGDVLNLGLCNFTAQAGQTLREIAQLVGRSSSVPFDVRVADSVGTDTILRSKTVSGKAQDALRDIAKTGNGYLYADNGGVNIGSLSQGPPENPIELNVKTGLIGMPQQTDQGVEVTCLINPDMKLDSWFHLNNQLVNLAELPIGSMLGTAGALTQPLLDRDGYYRIIAINVEGDTRGNDWYLNIQAISQAGVLPALLIGEGAIGT